MAGSSIISEAMLTRRLPSDAYNGGNEIVDAVYASSALVNSVCSHYDPFDEYTASPEATAAPREIVDATYRIAEAMYFMNVGTRHRNGEELPYWQKVVADYTALLRTIRIEPLWVSQSIVLDANNAMGIGDRNAGGMWPRVIPQTAQVISAGSSVWLQPDDWEMRRGGSFTDEYPDRWYLYASSSSVEGTLRYMRTFRNDAYDYAKYGRQ